MSAVASYFAPPAGVATRREQHAAHQENLAAATLARRLSAIVANVPTAGGLEERLRLQAWSLDQHAAELNRIADWRLGNRTTT